ncbi:Crp/Fnr family transcriptional regulator [Paenibacillus segetis]|uniref:Cyclic nucleotide-binding protein n=1 Tax=Paenibacillus segetis TaxID=1325360 RepID=A0ABQ1YRQ8_9BACL|nr:Crp/Fnr family transcriptional regulator [Paenibacillus segetis]GGH36309.1 cyclic nucleotide-binding protein [Paenibacillus segetis]
MHVLPEQKIRQIQQLFPSFSHVPDDSWNAAEILSITPSTPHSIREGHMLQHAMFIMGGQIRIFKISPTGREITLYRVSSGQSCVLMMASILGETEYEASVSIEENTEVLLLPVHVFRGWMDTIKPIRQYIYKQFIDRMTNVTQLLENIAFQPIPYRIAEYLILASANTDHILLTHEQLAIEIGTSREVITRVLRDFVNLGAIRLSRGKIKIIDHHILQNTLDRFV